MISEINKIYNEDCLQGLGKLPHQCVDCIITSPPYFGLRDYGVKGQIGLEESPQMFVEKIVGIFHEAKRVLRNNGTMWLNLGDSYAAYKANTGDTSFAGIVGRPYHKSGWQYGTLKQKDLIGIPWRVAFALQTDGWYLRQDIIWHKPNPMPESVTDRCTKAHEYLFLLSKSQRYYYDHKAIMQPVAESSVQRLDQDIESQNGSGRVPGKTNGAMKAKASWNGSSFDKGKTGEMKLTNDHLKNLPETQSNIRKFRTKQRSGNKARKSRPDAPENNGRHQMGSVPWEGYMANKRSVWTVTTKPFKEAHFATFPEELIIDCIKAGCPIGGIVLDPFMGAGTTALVARKLNRNFIGFELNPKYIEIAEKRLYKELGMFA